MDTVLQIPLLGIDTSHHPDHVIDRPNGFNCYVLMCFSTRFFSRTVHGIELGEPGDCILHDPDFPAYHGTIQGSAEGFRNSWVFILGDRVAQSAERYGIPFNEIIRTEESHLLVPLLRTIKSELDFRKPYWDERLKLLVEEIFLTMGRYKQLVNEFESYTPAEQEQKIRFMEAKIQIHQHFQQDWPVKKMAALVNLSPDRFWVLYQKFFKVSPKDDLILKRLEEAKSKLINSSHSIEQIALDCGFNSLYYFSRMFKKRVGCTPSSYRHF